MEDSTLFSTDIGKAVTTSILKLLFVFRKSHDQAEEFERNFNVTVDVDDEMIQVQCSQIRRMNECFVALLCFSPFEPIEEW